MSMSKMGSEGYDLHEDIILKILCRLPVKSLIRFTCVSKRWRSIIISDPEFAKSHLELASQQGTICRKVLISIYPTLKDFPCLVPELFEDGVPWLPSRFQFLEGYSSVSNLTFPSEEKSQRVMASCNGLVLLSKTYQHYYEKFYIWNSSTAFVREIPGPSLGFEVTKSTEPYASFLCYGFGQVKATDDYKIVFIEPGLGEFVDVHVFSFRANVWKVITFSSSSFSGSIIRQGTLANEAIHWITYPISGVMGPTLVAFDLAEEEFRQVPLPVLDKDGDDIYASTHVFLGGCLCVQSWCEFWVMRQYGVPASWVRLIQYPQNDLPVELSSLYRDITFISEGGTILFKMLDKKELVWGEFCQEEHPVCSGIFKIDCPGAIFDAVVYDETLVSVPE